MKRTLACILGILLLAGCVSAYVINFEAPATLESGTTLYVTGTSTLPAGFTTEMKIYKKASVGNKEITTVPFTIQEGGEWYIEVDTTGWTNGEYTMSIPKNSEYSYGGSSKLLQAFSVTGNPVTKIPTTAPTEVATTTQTENPQTESTPLPTQSPVPVWLSLAGVLAGLVIARKIK